MVCDLVVCIWDLIILLRKFCDAPELLERPVTCTHYVDPNFFYDMLTGCLVIGIISIIKPTNFMGIPKSKQLQEQLHNGSVHVATRNCIEQLVNLCNT